MLPFVLELLLHFVVSMLRLSVSATFTVLFALPIGWAVYKRKFVRKVVQTLCAVPAMALLPVIMLGFGIGEGSKIVLLILSSVWVCALRLGGAYKKLYYLLQPFLINDFPMQKVLAKAIFPALNNDICESFRHTFLVNITLLLFAENYGTRYGVGYYINHAWQAFDYAGIVWGILLAAIMGICCNFIIEKGSGYPEPFLLNYERYAAEAPQDKSKIKTQGKNSIGTKPRPGAKQESSTSNIIKDNTGKR